MKNDRQESQLFTQKKWWRSPLEAPKKNNREDDREYLRGVLLAEYRTRRQTGIPTLMEQAKGISFCSQNELENQS